jgi:hypothetical protein
MEARRRNSVTRRISENGESHREGKNLQEEGEHLSLVSLRLRAIFLIKCKNILRSKVTKP